MLPFVVHTFGSPRAPREVRFVAKYNASTGAEQDLSGFLLFFSNISLRMLLNHSLFFWIKYKNTKFSLRGKVLHSKEKRKEEKSGIEKLKQKTNVTPPSSKFLHFGTGLPTLFRKLYSYMASETTIRRILSGKSNDFKVCRGEFMQYRHVLETLSNSVLHRIP